MSARTAVKAGNRGAYILYLEAPVPLNLRVGGLGDCYFPSGRYVYVGSASGGIDRRVSRHRRLALLKSGKIHWHIDYLLVQPGVRLMRCRAAAGGNECEISRTIAAAKGVTTPVRGFGSSDCAAGCAAHLYYLGSRRVRNSAFTEA